MIRIHPRRLAIGSRTFALAVLGMVGTGCAGDMYTRPVAPPPAGYGTRAEYVQSPLPDDVDTQVARVPSPPVVDIESYPSVVYDGAAVYYVGGVWYRQGAHGWSYYRQEPQELRRQRQAHEQDPRWARARAATRPDGESPAAPPGVTAPQPPAGPAGPMPPRP